MIDSRKHKSRYIPYVAECGNALRKGLLFSMVVAIAVVLPATASLAPIEKVFTSDGVIEKGEIYDKVEVRDTKPLRTTVSMSGGTIGDQGDPQSGMFTYDSSTVNISGGGLLMLHTYNSSTINVSGGIIGIPGGPNGSTVTARDSSTINIYEKGFIEGGSASSFELYDSSTLNVYGGDVSLFFTAHDYSIVNIHDGSFFAITLADHSTVNIYGGDLATPWGAFYFSASATVNIYGYHLEYNPRWSWSDDPMFGPRWVSRLTGRGFDGTPIEITGIADPSKYPNIHIIPEPTTVLLLGLGGLALVRTQE